ncbi:unnamed protein product [Urochloa decumbens]|uniref:F-box domain-containing protein n=1 Tax=Urochloa decumbens TaxID=240449 RepID=A0ABC9D8C7_9POAL
MASTRCADLPASPRGRGIAADIPDDLIFSILSRLPANSVIRFRCVSKSWLAMTSSQTFIDAHLGFSKASGLSNLVVPGEPYQQKRGPKTPLCMEFYKYTGGTRVGELVYRKHIPGEFSERAPPLHCDGLILTYTRDQEIMVCNPATKEFLALPKGTTHGVVGDQLVGFGRDPCSNKYKVARFFRQRRAGSTSLLECKFEVLTLGTEVWRRAVDPPCRVLDQSPPHVRGFIYWMPYLLSNRFFVCFSLADEIFSLVQYPPCQAEPVAFIELEGDELSCACLAGASDHQVVEIWTCTNTDVPAWTRRCTVQLPPEKPVPGPGASLGLLNTISIYKNDLFFGMAGDGLYRYSIGTGVTKKVRCPVSLGDEVSFYPVNYTESLVQVKGQVTRASNERILSRVLSFMSTRSRLCFFYLLCP